MDRMLRVAIAFFGVVALVLALGFFFQLSWATSLWPWPTSRLSNIFLSGILAAIGVPVLWIALTGELAATVGGVFNFVVMFGVMGAFAFRVYATDTNREDLLLFGVVCVVTVLSVVAIALWTRRTPFRQARPAPWPIRASFVLFMVVLLLVGGGLVLGYPNIFPWPLKPEQSVVHGWILLGSATYFIYGLWKPVTSNVKGQLMGFLAYDVVLIVPFMQHFQTVRPDLWINLVAYVAVLVYSAALAAYYLFVRREP